jgi:hypothetical protein
MKAVMKQIMYCAAYKTHAIKFANIKMQDSVTHSLEKAMLKAIPVLFSVLRLSATAFRYVLAYCPFLDMSVNPVPSS